MVARVVSLVPSVTETLAALGVDPVACTRFCERPDLPAVGGTKDPHVGEIVALAPDVVVMNDEENRREDRDKLVAAGIRVVDVSPRTVTAVGEVVRTLAALVKRVVPAPFERSAAGAEPWLDALPAGGAQRRAVTFVWRRPWMALGADSYGLSVLEQLGVVNAIAGTDRYPEVTLDAVRAAEPDLIVLPSEPYPFGDRHRAELTRALGDVRVVLVDGQDLFWWGIRTPDALRRLGAQLA